MQLWIGTCVFASNFLTIRRGIAVKPKPQVSFGQQINFQIGRMRFARDASAKLLRAHVHMYKHSMFATYTYCHRAALGIPHPILHAKTVKESTVYTSAWLPSLDHMHMYICARVVMTSQSRDHRALGCRQAPSRPKDSHKKFTALPCNQV